MLAAETVEGLERLGVVHHTTLPYSPEQNGKQESFWGQIEGRLLPMLEGEPELSLVLLNTATQAWAEEEYQRKLHSEIHESPLDRYLRGPSVARESPTSDALRRAFRTEISRQQRRSDGTVRTAPPTRTARLPQDRRPSAIATRRPAALLTPRTSRSLAPRYSRSRSATHLANQEVRKHLSHPADWLAMHVHGDPSTVLAPLRPRTNGASTVPVHSPSASAAG
jgi:hypothetical protein